MSETTNEHSENEIHPEDLPFKDPVSKVDCSDSDLGSDVGSDVDSDVDSEDGITENDGWWEKDPDSEDPQHEDYGVRVDNQPLPTEERNTIIDELEKIVRDSFKGQGKARKSTFNELTLSRICLMLMSLQLSWALDCGIVRGSQLAVIVVGRAQRLATLARRWIRDFWRTRKLPANLYGASNESIIEDEGLKVAILQHLQRIGRYAGPKDIVAFFSTPEAKPFTHLLDQPPSIRAAQHWMLILGYKWKTEWCGQFADGHEREDVVDFRMNNYILKWIELEHWMQSWDRDGKEIAPDLKEGEREATVHWHDEVIYQAHDRRLSRWIPNGEEAGIYKKGEGQSLMVAHMISAKYGFLQCRWAKPSEAMKDRRDDAMVVFHPGKEHDGYFCNNDVCEQLKRAMTIVEEEYPHEDHIFIFDNATTHTKLPDNAPIVSKMTLGASFKVHGEAVGPSGEKIKVKYAPGRLTDGTPQEFYYPDNHPRKDL